MGVSDWLLVLNRNIGTWEDYYLPKFESLTDTVVWHYKLPYVPETNLGCPVAHPRLFEDIYLAYDKVIKGFVRNQGVITTEDPDGFPVVGETKGQGAGVYITLSGAYETVAFKMTDGNYDESQVLRIPKALPGLRHFSF